MKTLLATFVFLNVAIGISAQTVNFHNGVAFQTRADRIVRDNCGRPMVGTNYVAQLYYGAPGSSQLVGGYQPSCAF